MNIHALLGTLGVNHSPDQVAALQRLHAAGVRAAKERFRSWGAWKLISRSGAHSSFDVYQNSEYTAAVAKIDTRHYYFGVVTYLMCSRRDGEPVHSWLDLQQIKNTLVGEELLAIEVYPPESHLLDTVNCYHLWALPKCGFDFPLDLKVLERKRSRESQGQNRSHKSQRQLQRELYGSARHW